MLQLLQQEQKAGTASKSDVSSTAHTHDEVITKHEPGVALDSSSNDSKGSETTCSVFITTWIQSKGYSVLKLKYAYSPFH